VPSRPSDDIERFAADGVCRLYRLANQGAGNRDHPIGALITAFGSESYASEIDRFIVRH
jgi:hypothetical protein